MDAISLLKKDHRTVEALFKQYDKLGEGAAREKKAIVQQIVRELSIHASVEEELLYPTAKNSVPNEEDKVLESLEEHHLVKVTLSELESLSPTHPRYDAKVKVLEESVKHHVEEEEAELFPALQKKLDKEKLNALGRAIEAAKKVAPTRPHPSAPDEPPGNLIAGLPAAMFDKIRDLVSGVAKRGQALSSRTNGAHESASAPKKKSAAKSGRKTMGARAAHPRMSR